MSKNTVPDYTFGGIIQGVLACDMERFLRQFIGKKTIGIYNTAGIYTGQVNDYFHFGSNAGQCAVFVSTNGQVTIIADDTLQQQSIFEQTTVDSQGHVGFFNKNVSGYGSFTNGSFSIQLYYTNGVSVSLDGNQLSPDDFLQNGAGFYTGSFSGSGSGSLDAVVGADGEVYFCSIQGGVVNDFGTGQIDSDNNFTGYTDGGISVMGTNKPSTLTISGTYDDGQGGTGSFTLKNPVRVLVTSDVPPAITTDLPPSTSKPLGSLVKLSVGVNGSAPLCYQWYHNDVLITNASSNPLVISNVQYADAGNYSVTIQNVVGATNSAVENLAVTPENIPPTASITSPKAGSSVSNSALTVIVKAADNAGVSNVLVQLNNLGWNPATFDGTNWTAQVTLTTPGPNTVQAYAVDTSANLSVTNPVSFNYVVSAPLTVQITGKGTVTPNDNNTLLAIGTTNLLKAAAISGSGFVFANWSGGTSLPLALLTNGPTVKFVMVSNLVLQANFVDVMPPTVIITNPIASEKWSNSAALTVSGKCADNLAVSNVWVQLNSGGFNPVDSFNLTNWSAPVILTPGTNTVQAFAVDTTGNRSLTNTVKFFYSVNALLTVNTNGAGSVSPNYNGKPLLVGVGYSMTATAAKGFGFVNWTDGTSNVVSSKAALPFLMASNLTLQSPILRTSRRQRCSSPIRWPARSGATRRLYTISGKCADNLAVSNVWVQLNGGGFNPVNSFNLTNWSAPVILTPGTNTVQAFAVDTTGNHSLTNTVKFFYSVNALLTVNTNGAGSVSPNYNGKPLLVGVGYSMTATAAKGFGFVNWTDGSTNVVSTKAALPFLMASNLTFVANFADITPPTLLITNPVASEKWSNSTAFTVSGKCADNVAVSIVQVQVNTGGYNPAGTLNVTNWAALVSLTPGTNTVQAFAMDSAGNHSITNSVKFVYLPDTRFIFGSWNLLQFETPGPGVF